VAMASISVGLTTGTGGDFGASLGASGWDDGSSESEVEDEEEISLFLKDG
jgi:hypothetical protein